MIAEVAILIHPIGIGSDIKSAEVVSHDVDESTRPGVWANIYPVDQSGPVEVFIPYSNIACIVMAKASA
jgi:hypothetical protein